MKKTLCAVAIALLLLLFCLCLSSPQMVVFAEESYAPLPIAGAAPYAPNPAGFSADGYSYSDPSLTIASTTDRAFDTDVLIVDISLEDASQFRTMMAGGYGSKASQSVTRMAKAARAVLACNGDWYDMYQNGVVVRGGKLFRNSPVERRDMLLVDEAGDFHILAKPEQGEYEALAAEYPPMHVFSFGPALIVDGRKQGDFMHHECGPEKKRGRMAIAQTGPLHYLLIVTEDTTEKLGDDDAGMTIPEFVEYLSTFENIKQAYNLDGGNSTYVDMNGVKLNAPYRTNARLISDIIYFATLVPDGEE